MIVVLVGFMGAGKTTIGHIVAGRLGLPFVDSDVVLEQRLGRSIKDIFETEGETFFRELEHRTVTELVRGPDAVLALGGGALGDERTRAALRDACVVHLRVAFSEAMVRVRNDPFRPMLRRPDLEAVYRTRQEAYEAASAFDVDTDGRRPDEVATEVLELLGRPHPSPGRPRRAAVLGLPVQHSLSPTLHHAAYEALGLRGWRYERIECDENGLAELVAGLDPDWVGLSLTMPLKRVALEVADEVSPLAAAVGAANTLLLDGARRADNTDVVGIAETLREAGLRRVDHAVVLGAGGTAQAALAALGSLGARTPSVIVRDLARTAELRATAERLDVRPVILDGLFDGPLPETDVVISTLPSRAADPLAAMPWRGRPVVLDVDYAAWPSALAGSALRAGCTVVSGLTVLLHQAVAQVRLMTGLAPPVEAMRAALDARAGITSSPRR